MLCNVLFDITSIDKSFFVGNTIFSATSLLIIIKSYKMNMHLVNGWTKKYKNISLERIDINYLNKIHFIMFGYPQIFIIFTIIIARRIVCYFWQIPTIGYQFQVPETIGSLIIDTLTIFLVLFIIISFVGYTLFIYVIACKGLKVKSSFKIRIVYKDLFSLAVMNAVYLGIFSTIYGICVLVWGVKHSLLGIGFFINLLIVLPILVSFLLGIYGIQVGMEKTKKNTISDTLENFASDKRLHNLIYREIICKKLDDIQKINIWVCYPDSLSIIIITILSTTVIRMLLQYVLSYIFPF